MANETHLTASTEIELRLSEALDLLKDLRNAPGLTFADTQSLHRAALALQRAHWEVQGVSLNAMFEQSEAA